MFQYLQKRFTFRIATCAALQLVSKKLSELITCFTI